LTWARNRLFSTGLHGYILEHDLHTLREKQRIPIFSGPSWCIAAHSDFLAVGSEDGRLCLYQLVNDEVEYRGTLAKQESRVLCLSWKSCGKILVCAGSGYISTVNRENGQLLNRMTIGDRWKEQGIVVWSVAVFDDFTIVSGDTSGTTTFWNGELGCEITKIQSHKADVLSVCIGGDQNTVYSAGIDPTIVMFSRVQSAKESQSKWMKSIQRTVHLHDVKCLAMLDDCQLISAGVDSYLGLSYYSPAKTILKYPGLPSCQSAIKTTEEQNIVMFAMPHHLEVWKLFPADKSSADISQSSSVLSNKSPSLILKLKSRHQEAVTSAAISADASVLAYSTPTNLRMFKLEATNASAPKLSKLSVCDEELHELIIHQMVFVDRSLYLICPHHICVVEVDGDSAQVKQTEKLKKFGITKRITGSYLSKPKKLEKRLLILTDSEGAVFGISVSKMQLSFKIPPVEGSLITAIEAQPRTNNLVVAYSSRKIIEYDITQGKFTEFGVDLGRHLPASWYRKRHPILKISFDKSNPNVVFLHDDGVIYTLFRRECSGGKSSETPSERGLTKEIKMADSSSGENGHSDRRKTLEVKECDKYQHLLYFGALNSLSGEMMAIEIEPMQIVEKLPSVLKVKRFGT